MDTSRINDIRDSANRAAISDIANQLAAYTQLGVSEQQLKEYILEVAYVLNEDYGTCNTEIDDYIHNVDKELHGKEADKKPADQTN